MATSPFTTALNPSARDASAFSPFSPQGMPQQEIALQQEVAAAQALFSQARAAEKGSLAFHEIIYKIANLSLIRDFESVLSFRTNKNSPGSRLDLLDKFNASHGYVLSQLNTNLNELRVDAGDYMTQDVAYLTNWNEDIDAETDINGLSEIASKIGKLQFHEKLRCFAIPKDKGLEEVTELLLDKCRAKIHAVTASQSSSPPAALPALPLTTTTTFTPTQQLNPFTTQLQPVLPPAAPQPLATPQDLKAKIENIAHRGQTYPALLCSRDTILEIWEEISAPLTAIAEETWSHSDALRGLKNNWLDEWNREPDDVCPIFGEDRYTPRLRYLNATAQLYLKTVYEEILSGKNATETEVQEALTKATDQWVQNLSDQLNQDILYLINTLESANPGLNFLAKLNTHASEVTEALRKRANTGQHKTEWQAIGTRWSSILGMFWNLTPAGSYNQKFHTVLTELIKRTDQDPSWKIKRLDCLAQGYTIMLQYVGGLKQKGLIK